MLVCSISIFAQNDEQPYRSKNQYIKLSFSEPMSTIGLFDKNNYVVYDELGDTVTITGVGYPTGTDTAGGLDYSILITERWNYDLYHTIKAYWLKDRAGNLIAENNTAFTFLPLVDTTLDPPNVRVGPTEIVSLTIDTVYASGQEDINHGPEKAIDGISYSTPGSTMNNCWTSCCLASPGGQWFVAGFDESHFIEDLIISGTYYYNARSYGLKIQISQDNISWEDIANVATTPSVEWSTFSIGRRAKFVKIVFLTNSSPTSNWAGLWELRITGN